MRLRYSIPLLALWFAVPAALGQSREPDAMATRRAERDAERTQRMSSRPVTLRGPIPLPVRPVAPAGGAPAWRSCPSSEPCRLEIESPAGQLLVVTALWSATAFRCDETSGGPTPPGKVIAPWWHCTRLTLEGPGAGFTGFFAPLPPSP